MIQTRGTPPEVKTFGVKNLRISPEMIRVTTVRELCAWPTWARASGIQLFIATATPWLDKKHTIFVRAVGGLEDVHAIENTRTNVTNHLRICIEINNINISAFSGSYTVHLFGESFRGNRIDDATVSIIVLRDLPIFHFSRR